MERRPAVGSKCGVGILHVCQVKTITKNVPTIILTVHLRIWLIISRKLSLCGLFWTTLYINQLMQHFLAALCKIIIWALDSEGSYCEQCYKSLGFPRYIGIRGFGDIILGFFKSVGLFFGLHGRKTAAHDVTV